jgi:hypothetical protein
VKWSKDRPNYSEKKTLTIRKKFYVFGEIFRPFLKLYPLPFLTEGRVRRAAPGHQVLYNVLYIKKRTHKIPQKKSVFHQIFRPTFCVLDFTLHWACYVKTDVRESKYTIGLICSRSQINLKVDSFGSAEPSFRGSSWMTIIFFWDDSLTDERECFLWMFWCPDNLPYCLKCTHARSGYAVSLKKRNTVKSAFRILTPSVHPGGTRGETKEKNWHVRRLLSTLRRRKMSISFLY